MDAKQIRKAFEERGIRKVKVGGFDVDGILRGKIVSTDKFWSALDKGFGFCDVIFGWDVADVLYDNGHVTGWHTGYPDAHARIDPSTFRVLRYEPDTACFLADFWGEDGKPHPACPRNLLKAVVARVESAGYQPRAAVELEFFVFRETPDTLEEKGFRGLQPLSPGMFGYSWVREGQHADFLHDALDTLHAFGIPVEGIHTETGPGVYEAAIQYADPLTAADQGALFKTTMKQVARRHGLAVTFMAKWNASLPGCSGHLHQSLWGSAAEQNLFADPRADHGLSELGRHYIGGLVKLAPELTALYSPFVNTYKRYVPGVWAPLNATWGIENRTCAVRLINGPGKKATRAEYRQTASDINPYIALATSLGAGLWGVERQVEPPPPVDGDATDGQADPPALPRTLAKATELLSRSEAAREILGEAFVDHYVRTRDWEARRYDLAVTDWELRRYFEAV